MKSKERIADSLERIAMAMEVRNELLVEIFFNRREEGPPKAPPEKKGKGDNA